MLHQRLDAVEAVGLKRENVTRFLIARFLLMLAMVAGFWLAMRERL